MYTIPEEVGPVWYLTILVHLVDRCSTSAQDCFATWPKTSVRMVDDFGTLTGHIEDHFGTSILVHWYIGA